MTLCDDSPMTAPTRRQFQAFSSAQKELVVTPSAPRGTAGRPPPQRATRTGLPTVTWSTSDTRTVTFIVHVPASGRLTAFVAQ